ncbi:MAG: DUF2029 domain-containing protein [Bacteroidia bacterium]
MSKLFEPKGLLIGFIILYSFILLNHVLSNRGGDFKNYYTAAKYILNDQNPYTNLVFEKSDGSQESLVGYGYSPFFAICMVPLSLLPYKLALSFWYLVNCIFLFKTFRVLFQIIPNKVLTSSKYYLTILFTLLFFIRFLDNNFELGQISIFLVYLSLMSLWLIIKGYDKIGAIFIGFATSIKIVPGLLIFTLLVARKNKAFFYSLGALIMFLLFPIIFLGLERFTELNISWFDDINPISSKFMIETKAGLFNLSAFVPAMFSVVFNLFDNEITSEYNFAIQVVIYMLRVALIIPIFQLFQKRKSLSRGEFIYIMVYTLLIVPLVFPRQSKYAFLFQLPMVFLLINYLLYSQDLFTKSRPLIVGLVLVFICFNGTSINIVGRNLYDIFQEVKLITIGSLILVIISISYKVKIINVINETAKVDNFK